MKDFMQAVSIREPGGPDVLEPVSRPLPELRENDVLIRVRAAGVNRPDILQRTGKYPVPADADPLPGLEVAGRIAAVGTAVQGWRAGDRVMALTHGGGYAEFCKAHEGHCLPVPEGMPWVEAAAIPETYFTVWYNVFMRARLEAGESILIHGGSSGIGTTAIQLCKSAGAHVITTAGSDEKCRFCESLGADNAINYKTEDWEKIVRKETSVRGIDMVLDMVAGPYMQKNLSVLGRDGRYVIIAFLAGPKAELNLRDILTKRLTVTGSTLRPQSINEKSAIAADLREHVLPLLVSGAVKPIIHATYPLTDAARAHALMESSQHMGKIVLETEPEA